MSNRIDMYQRRSLSVGHYTRDKLSEEQTECLNQFIQVMWEEGGLTAQERKFCDEACLIRYLVARDWNVGKAHKMLRNTLKWREEFKPDQITFEDIKESAESGKIYQFGSDKHGRPIVVMTPGRENCRDYPQNMKFLVYMIERCIERMPPGQQQMVWIVDFKGYSRHNAMPLNVGMEAINILSSHYPERLGMGFLLDTPWIFSLLWKAVSPFINPSTHQKISFISGATKGDKLAQHIDPGCLEKRFGGHHRDLEYRLEECFMADLVSKLSLEDERNPSICSTHSRSDSSMSLD